MSSLRRIVPEWKYLLPQLKQTIQDKENGLEDYGVEDKTVYLDATPQIQFRYVCAPNCMRCLTSFSSQSCTFVVGLQWRHSKAQCYMKVWRNNVGGELVRFKSFPLGRGYKVEHLLFIPDQYVFIGACDDLSLRVFSDPLKDRGVSVKYKARLLDSVFCMHYCQKTRELLTGSLGVITFWGLWTAPRSQLSIVRVLDWSCCSLQCDTLINALVTDQESLYALCDSGIKHFDLKSKKELRPFHGRGQGTLQCISPDWGWLYLYTGDAAGCVQVWSKDTRCLEQEFQAHSCSVSTVLVRPNTHTVLTSSSDSWVKEWNCTGDLLLRVFMDEPGGILSLWPLEDNCILCHSHSSFSVCQFQDVYQLFRDSRCGMRYLKRLECGDGWARLLAVGQDSIVQLISPVNGVLLLLSWPFSFLNHALDFAYSPIQQELFVANGTSQVLVLDTSLCPCPAKRILHTSKSHDSCNGVMCLEAVMMDREEWGDLQSPVCLVFSGHFNGELQLLSPYKLCYKAQKNHDGAILQISSLAGQTPQLCCYSSDKQLTVWEVEMVGSKVELTLVSHVSCCSTLVFSQLLPDFVFAVSPFNSLLFYSLEDGKCLKMERNSPSKLSCMDYCPTLGVVVLSDCGGNVEVWDAHAHGVLLAVIYLGTPADKVCFANARGDLLACFKERISIIFGLRYLPTRLLRQVLDQAPVDDLLENPIPFVPDTCSSYNLTRVPWFFNNSGPVSPEAKITPAIGTVKALELDQCVKRRTLAESTVPSQKDQRDSQSFISPFVQNLHEKETIVEDQKEEITAEEEKEERIIVKEIREKVIINCEQIQSPGINPDTKILTQGRPIAPDGFIPNSVIRNWSPKKVQFEKSDKLVVPKALQRDFTQCREESERLPEVFKLLGKAQPEKPQILLKRFDMPPHTTSEEEEENCDDTWKDILKQIAESMWLLYKPEVNLESVLKAILQTMETMDLEIYNSCSEALIRLFDSYVIPPELVQNLTFNMLQHIQKDNPHWKRLEGLKTLDQLNLVEEQNLFCLAEVLTDDVKDVRQLGRLIMGKSHGIKDKTKLITRLQNNKEATTKQKLIKQLERQLTQDLDLHKSIPTYNTSTRRLSRRLSHKTYKPRVENTLQLTDMPSQKQESTWIPELPLLTTLGQTKACPPTQDTENADPTLNDEKVVPQTQKEYKELPIYLPEHKVTEPKAEVEVLPDLTVADLCKKSTPKQLSQCQLPKSSLSHCQLSKLQLPSQHSTLPSDSGLSTMSSQTPSMVQLPPPSQPQQVKLASTEGQGDLNWRECLHKLISIYNFRSPKAHNMHKLVGQPFHRAPSAPTPCLPCALPPLLYRQCSELSVGQRLVQRVEMRESREKPRTQFRHCLPMPWQLNTHTLDLTGECQYGRLKMHWSRGPLQKPIEGENQVKPPPVRAEMYPSLATLGGSAS